MRIKFPDGFEAEYENTIAAGFIHGCGAVELRPPKPVVHNVRWGVETSAASGELFISANCSGCGGIARFQPRGSGPFTEPPKFRHGSICPPDVLAYFNSTRVSDWDHEIAIDRAQRERDTREEATRKQRITEIDVLRVSQI